MGARAVVRGDARAGRREAEWDRPETEPGVRGDSRGGVWRAVGGRAGGWVRACDGVGSVVIAMCSKSAAKPSHFW